MPMITLRESEALRETEHPLHDYVTATVGRLVQALPVAHEARDACPLGRSSRYSDEQCEYHYRSDRDFLLSLLD